jgi:hypothetical protein
MTTTTRKVSETATAISYPENQVVPHEWVGKVVRVLGPAAYQTDASECELVEPDGRIAYVRNEYLLPVD